MRLLSADKLNEAALPAPLAFQWVDKLGTLGLVNHGDNGGGPGNTGPQPQMEMDMDYDDDDDLGL